MDELEIVEVPREKEMYIHARIYENGKPFIYLSEEIEGDSQYKIYKVKIPLV
jgi:hypothetical protein